MNLRIGSVLVVGLVWGGTLGTAGRSLEAAPPNPQKFLAISQVDGSNPGAPRDSVLVYDISSIGSGAANVFNPDGDADANPLFSIWTGYEGFVGDANGSSGQPAGDLEDPSALAVNPVNGMMYLIAFDSGSPAAGFPNPNPNANPDPLGDNDGDWDLFRFDFQAILNDFVSNSRPKGVVYAPRRQLILTAGEQQLMNDGSPLFDGTVDGIAHNVPHPESASVPAPPAGDIGATIFMDTAIQKIGEMGRAQGATTFFDTELEFVNPETLIFLDTRTGDTPDTDFQIRAAKRVSASPGMATIDPNGPDNILSNADDQQGGRSGPEVTQSWESSIAGFLDLDAEINGGSDPTAWAYVKKDGVFGVWVSDGDGGNTGDDVAFYEIDFSGPKPVATKKALAGLPSSVIGVAENPAVNPATDNGDVDFLQVDKNGNLVIGESGFFDVVAGSTTPPLGNGGETAEQPKVIIAGIDSYAGAQVLPRQDPNAPGTEGFDSPSVWTTTANLAPTLTNDNEVINGTRVAYDKGTGWIYFIDQDNAASGFAEDIYVFDPATGQIIYEELNPFNIGFYNSHTQMIFVRGDTDGSGDITYADIQAIQNAIVDPTLGGTVSAAVGQEWYDLTGDFLLTAADLAELLDDILGTKLGDFNIDGMVNAADLALFQAGFGAQFDGADFVDWQRNLGFSNMPLAAVPEPTACGLAVFAALAVVGSRRRTGNRRAN